MPGQSTTSPLMPAGPAAGRVQQILYGTFLGLLMVSISTGLINVNKYLMSDNRFPFAVVIITMQSLFCMLFAGIMLPLCPSLFPALADPEKRVHIDMDFLVKRTAPIALFTTISLVLSNIAYEYASVAFLQMLKESNVAFVYVLSVMAALEAFKVRNALVIFLIVAATAMTVCGDMHFSFVGLVLQGLCCLAESSKVVVQGLLLSGSGRKLDGLSYVLVVMPQVLLGVSFLIFVDQCVIDIPWVSLPTWAQIIQFRSILIANMFMAFGLNVVGALFIKNSSPLAFLLANIAKDAMIVMGSSVAFHQPLSTEQRFAFPMQLSLILLWSLMKSFPESFQDGGRLSFIFPPGLREKKPETWKRSCGEQR